MSEEYIDAIRDEIDQLTDGDKKVALLHIGVGIGIIVDHMFNVITDSDLFYTKID